MQEQQPVDPAVAKTDLNSDSIDGVMQLSKSNDRSSSKLGPKSAMGKLRSSRNSRVHGLLSRELMFTGDDEARFLAMRNRLRKELAPDSAMEELLFDDLATCYWRLVCAVRLEQIELTGELKRGSDVSVEMLPTDSASDRLANFGYLEVRRRYKLLNELRIYVKHHSGPSAEFEKPVTEVFGAEFWRMLKEWETPSWYTLREFTKFCELQDAGASLPPADQAELDKYSAIQSNVQYQMQRKLIDLEIHHLLRSGREQEAFVNARARQGEKLDLILRYETKVRRDFYRAYAEFM
jgi:hypothetical protein